jgi:hypothetical protein
MSFIARELERVSNRLRQLPLDSLEYEKAYAAQQALAWALEPEGFRSPYDTLTNAPPLATADVACPTVFLVP